MDLESEVYELYVDGVKMEEPDWLAFANVIHNKAKKGDDVVLRPFRYSENKEDFDSGASIEPDKLHSKEQHNKRFVYTGSELELETSWNNTVFAVIRVYLKMEDIRELDRPAFLSE